jgi:hypothetical protein
MDCDCPMSLLDGIVGWILLIDRAVGLWLPTMVICITWCLLREQLERLRYWLTRPGQVRTPEYLRREHDTLHG